MKTGKTISEWAAELDRQNDAKRDYNADTRKLEMTGDGHLVIDIPGSKSSFNVTHNTHRQIGTRLKIPANYYDRLLNDHPELLAQNVNTLFHNEPEPRLIRTMNGHARAFLSNKYRCLDNYDLSQAILPVLSSVPDMRIESCELTESRMYIKALFPRIEGEIAKGDVVQSGVVISNSEIGKGSLRVEPLVFRLVCLNGMIAADHGTKKYHVGRATDGGESAFEIFRDETLQADDKAFWLKVQDTVRASVDSIQFNKILEGMRNTKEMRIQADPVEVVERVQKHFSMSDDERGNVLRHLIEGGDLTGYGMLNAITRTSQDLDDYDRSTDFERMGGQIIELSNDQWIKLAA